MITTKRKYYSNQKSAPRVTRPSMSSNLSTFVEKLVTIITTDGRLLVGYLRGYDQTTNLVLSAAQERTISPDEPCTTEDLGLYILRGDNVALVGETDDEKDQSINWYEPFSIPLEVFGYANPCRADVRGATLGDTKHAT